jgi:Na+/H+-dicarboxylate symporter
MFFALVSGISSLGDSSHNVLRVSLKGFITYIVTAIFAVVVGLVAGNIFKPGVGVDLSAFHGVANDFSAKTEPFSLSEFVLNLIPKNPIQSMATDNFLQLVIFSIFVGVSINLVGEKAKPVKELAYSASQVTFKMVNIIMKLAPLGAFGFMAWSVGTQGVEILASLAKLILAVVVACGVQYILFGVMITIFGKVSPFPFYKKMLFTQSLAFATSSSKATLPTAMTQLQEKMGVSKSSSNFLMPLGASMNMDGMAIYLGICALFFAQAYGVELTVGNYAMLVLTCTLGSIGGAGIPSGSLFFMGMVLTSVGLPVEGIGLIVAVDRILDMLRTTINITGDATITLIIDSTEDTLDKDVYYSKDV